MFGIFRKQKSQINAKKRQDWEDLYVKASIAHSSFLNALDADINDLAFLASALGSIDGAIQALNMKADHVQMLAMGSTFAVKRLKDMERLQNISPEEQGDLIGKAMVTEELDDLRVQSGQVAYTIISAMPK